MVLRGRRVILRPVTPSDHARILAWQNESELAWWMDYDGPFTAADIEALERRASDEGHAFVIELDGAAVGRIGLNGFRERDGVCALYAYIGERQLWGQGLGRDAILTVLEFAFDELAMHLVELWTLAANERAIRAYRACGFSIDGTLPDRSRKGDQWLDRVVMSVRRPAFVLARDRWRGHGTRGPS